MLETPLGALERDPGPRMAGGVFRVRRFSFRDILDFSRSPVDCAFEELLTFL